MDCNYAGSSKQRRDLLKIETELLGEELPFEFGKNSQLKILKAACNYLKKEKHFEKLKFQNSKHNKFDFLFNYEKTLGNEGFIVCFSKIGELIYISETAYDYLTFKWMDLLLSYDFIYEMAHEQDRFQFKDLEENYLNYSNGNKFSFYSLWFASKIKRRQTSLTEYKLFKLTGHFDIATEMFIAFCIPILSVSNRETLSAYNSFCFMSIHNLDLKFTEISKKGENLLGYNFLDENFENMTLYDLISPESLSIISERHSQIIKTRNNKGFLDHVKLIHKNGYLIDCLLNLYFDNKGHIVCKYQLMPSNDIQNYLEYVSNFNRDWFLYSAHENNICNIDSNSLYINSNTPGCSREMNSEQDCIQNEENQVLNNQLNTFDESFQSNYAKNDLREFSSSKKRKHKTDNIEQIDSIKHLKCEEFNFDEDYKVNNSVSLNPDVRNLYEKTVDLSGFLKFGNEAPLDFELNCEKNEIDNIKKNLQKDLLDFQSKKNADQQNLVNSDLFQKKIENEIYFESASYYFTCNKLNEEQQVIEHELENFNLFSQESKSIDSDWNNLNNNEYKSQSSIINNKDLFYCEESNGEFDLTEADESFWIESFQNIINSV